MLGVRLGELCTLNYGKGLRCYEQKPDEALPIKVYGTNGPIGWTRSPLYDQPTIIIGRKGAYRGVHFASDPSWTIDTAYYLTLRTNNINLKWLYYRLLIVDINRLDTGSAIPSTKREDFYSIKIQVPPIKLQHRIADILSAYDDLIENNRRRIQLLEQAARLLYKEWFVRLRFPGNEHVTITDGVPEGWEKKTLGEIAPLKYGKGLKKDDRIPGQFPVYGSSGIVGCHNKALVKGSAIIVGRKGNVGSVYWSADDFYPIDTVYFVEKDNSSLYLYYALLHTAFISTDVAVPGLNRDFAHSRSILIPPPIILQSFEEILLPMYAQITNLQRYNAQLANARDILLPRLMKGEIAV